MLSDREKRIIDAKSLYLKIGLDQEYARHALCVVDEVFRTIDPLIEASSDPDYMTRKFMEPIFRDIPRSRWKDMMMNPEGFPSDGKLAQLTRELYL